MTQATATMDIRQAHAYLAGLRAGDAVTVRQDGSERTYTVQQEIRRMDGGGFGSWDHAAVTVGYGPGRYNFEITAARIAGGYVTVVTDVAL